MKITKKHWLWFVHILKSEFMPLLLFKGYFVEQWVHQSHTSRLHSLLRSLDQMSDTRKFSYRFWLVWKTIQMAGSKTPRSLLDIRLEVWYFRTSNWIFPRLLILSSLAVRNEGRGYKSMSAWLWMYHYKFLFIIYFIIILA